MSASLDASRRKEYNGLWPVLVCECVYRGYFSEKRARQAIQPCPWTDLFVSLFCIFEGSIRKGSNKGRTNTLQTDLSLSPSLCVRALQEHFPYFFLSLFFSFFVPSTEQMSGCRIVCSCYRIDGSALENKVSCRTALMFAPGIQFSLQRANARRKRLDSESATKRGTRTSKEAWIDAVRRRKERTKREAEKKERRGQNV